MNVEAIIGRVQRYNFSVSSEDFKYENWITVVVKVNIGDQDQLIDVKMSRKMYIDIKREFISEELMKKNIVILLGFYRINEDGSKTLYVTNFRKYE